MVAATIYRSSYADVDNQLHYRIFGRDVEGRRVDRSVLGTTPYFYVDAAEASTIAKVPKIIRQEPGPEALDHRSTIRCYTRFPFDVPEARSYFHWTGEADIVFTTRQRADHGLVHVELPPPNGSTPVQLAAIRPLPSAPAVTPRVLSIDIEVDDSKGFPRPEDPRYPVTAISFHDSGKNAYGVIHSDRDLPPEALVPYFLRPIEESVRVFQRPTEYDLLAAFGTVLERVDPDVIVAWNGYRFDFPYLGGRAARILSHGRPNEDIRRLVDNFEEKTRRQGGRSALVDNMVVYQRREMRQQSFALHAVATKVLGFGKVERPLSVSELQRTDPAKWLAYSVWDTHLLRLIDQKERLVPFILMFSQMAGIDPEDCRYNSRIVDGRLLKTARKSGSPRLCLPSKTRSSDEDDDEGARGALTLPTVPGFHDGVIGLDLEQEYPNLEATFGISPEARVDAPGPGIVSLPTGGHYRQEPMGLLAEAVLDMIDFRNERKRRIREAEPGSEEQAHAQMESTASKYVVNSFTGVLRSTHWRGYSKETFEDVTGMARLQLQYDKDHIEDPEWLSKVVGPGIKGRILMGDTDSCYFTIHRDTVQILDTAELNGIAQRIRDALNASFSEWAGRFGAKKNYTKVGVEGIFRRFVIPSKAGSTTGAKKRYFGVYDFQDGKDVRHLPIEKRLDIKGIEYRRFNTAPVSGSVQYEVIRLLMEGEDPRTIEKAIAKFTEEALAGKLDDELLIRCKMGRGSLIDYRRDKNGKDRTPLPFVRAMERWFHATNRPVNMDDEFHWAYTTDGGVMAIPLSMTLAEAGRLGIPFAMDRPRMVREAITDEVAKVLPESNGGSVAEGEW